MNFTNKRSSGRNECRRLFHKGQFERSIKNHAKTTGRFLNQRFTTTDYDNSRTIARWARHSIVTILFEENQPKTAKGIVSYSENETDVFIAVTWDEYGRCRNLLSNRMRHFDLV
jgi:hypothetical protein